MSVIRAFIAIPLPASLQERIYRETQPLRTQLNREIIRWVPPENIHITLKFLGDTEKEKLEKLKELLAKEITQTPSFEISVKNLSVFPNISRPSVVWIGVENNGKLSTLHQRVQAAASQIGSVPEKRRFSAHLTLGRVTRKGYNKRVRSQIRKTLEESAKYDFGKVLVDTIHIFQSKLTPRGAKYSTIFEGKLGDFVE